MAEGTSNPFRSGLDRQWRRSERRLKTSYALLSGICAISLIFINLTISRKRKIPNRFDEMKRLWTIPTATQNNSIRKTPPSRILLRASNTTPIIIIPTHQTKNINHNQDDREKEEEHPTYNHTLGSTYTSPTILRSNCTLTVIFLDPRLPSTPSSSPAWNALSSIIANTPPSTTCILLQTSACQTPLPTIYRKITKNAPPLLLDAIHRGNVRVTILDHTKYHLPSCRDFSPPTPAFMNKRYWGDDEFLRQDADTILIAQDDAVLCHHLDVNQWRDVAYVGAPWPREGTHGSTIAACRVISQRWEEFTGLKNLTIQEVCGEGRAPSGNGGLSLRSRWWMRRAIEVCPHEAYAGVETKRGDELVCRVGREVDMPEDLYFATVLRGLGAPMPSGFEAVLFSAEILTVELTGEMYGPMDNDERRQLARKRWGGHDALERYDKMVNGGMVMPIGWHKPWWFICGELLLDKRVQEGCPFADKLFRYQVAKVKRNRQYYNKLCGNSNERHRVKAEVLDQAQLVNNVLSRRDMKMWAP